MPTSWGGFSTEWYYQLFANEKVFSAFLNTIIVATISTIVSGIIGTLLAMGMELRKTNAYVEGVAFIPMIIPDIVMAISLLSFFTLIQLTLGLHSIITSWGPNNRIPRPKATYIFKF